RSTFAKPRGPECQWLTNIMRRVVNLAVITHFNNYSQPPNLSAIVTPISLGWAATALLFEDAFQQRIVLLDCARRNRRCFSGNTISTAVSPTALRRGLLVPPHRARQ